MFVVILLLLIVAALAVWIVAVAGPRFALQRLGGAVLIIVLVTLGTTALLRMVSTDAEQTAALAKLGLPASAQPCVSALGTGATVEAVEECIADRGLDKNIVAQYTSWGKQVLSGDLGYAFYKNKEPLTDTLKQRMPRTAFLFLYSQLIALALAVPLGIWAAYQAGRGGRKTPRWALPVGVVAAAGAGVSLGWGVVLAVAVAAIVPWMIFSAFKGGRAGDSGVNTLAFILLSVPAFVLAETLRYLFAIRWGVYELKGYAPFSDGVWAHLRAVWLPALVLGLSATPVYLRLLRADMIQNLQQDFVAVAKAKGMSNRHILLRHVLRPSTLTLMTVAGLNIAQLVNGGIVIEFIFDYDGMGSFLLEAVARREFFAVQTIVALVAVIFVLTNTIIDLLYTVVDPRVRVEASS